MSLKKTLISLLVFFSFTALYADIIITTDGMVLNGRIIEENKKTVKFANYHGTFIIDRNSIKKIEKTGSYRDDIKILRDMGRIVNESEIKSNYDAGTEILGKETSGTDRVDNYMLTLSPSFTMNSGKLAEVIPYSYGAAVSLDIPAGGNILADIIYMTHCRINTEYFRMEREQKNVTGMRISAGPGWILPASLAGHSFEYSLSACIGIGYYSVKGVTTSLDAAKWNISLTIGPLITLSSVIISPAIQLQYIHDNTAAFYGTGASIGIGMRF